jgi:hypothetical protein
MLRSALLGAAGFAALAVPAAAGAAPTALPSVDRVLTAAAGQCDRTAYQAPISGFLNVRLDAAGGDWDLLLRDGEGGAPLRSSRSFGATELIQGFVRAGQKLVAEGCHQSGEAGSATASFQMLDVLARSFCLTRSFIPSPTCHVNSPGL